MKPIIVLSDVGNRCVTFFRRNAQEHTIGYRLFEDSPKTFGTLLSDYEEHPASLLGNIPEIAPDWERVALGSQWEQITAGMYWERTGGV